MTQLAVFISTAAYSGYFPIAPGTVGSAVGLLVYGLVWWTGSPLVEVLLIVSLFAAGVWAATRTEQYFGSIDPGPIVLDEVVGMLITLAFIPGRLERGARRVRPVSHLRRHQALSRLEARDAARRAWRHGG